MPYARLTPYQNRSTLEYTSSDCGSGNQAITSLVQASPVGRLAFASLPYFGAAPVARRLPNVNFPRASPLSRRTAYPLRLRRDLSRIGYRLLA